MTLAALKDFDAETAAGILASMARDGLPTPFPDGNGDEYRPQKQAIDAELRERLQLKSGDLSASAKARFDMALTDALQATMASAQELDRTIEEMGQQGRVPPSFYEVVFEKNFRDLFRSFGASSKNMIANVIGNADAVEHLWPDFGDENDNRALSLFVKHFPASDKLPAHVRLAQTIRQGIQQNVQAFWYLFDSVETEKGDSPLRLLRNFVNVFGVPVTLDGSRWDIFIEAIDLHQVTGSVIEAGLNHKRELLREYFWSHSLMFDPEHQTVRRGLAYAIDLTKYAAELRRHGIATR